MKLFIYIKKKIVFNFGVIENFKILIYFSTWPRAATAFFNYKFIRQLLKY